MTVAILVALLVTIAACAVWMVRRATKAENELRALLEAWESKAGHDAYVSRLEKQVTNLRRELATPRVIDDIREPFWDAESEPRVRY